MSNVVVPAGAIDIVYQQTGKFLRKNVESRLIKEFEVLKREMLSEFDNHPVTRELEQKTSADPSSFVTVGSLFGFIGFEKNDEPITIVREMLKTSYIAFIRTKGAIVDFKVYYPSKEELFDATPLPYAAGRSWLKGIETGLSGLGRYLNVESDNSRSGGGIQGKGKVRSGKFKNTKYMSEILNNFLIKVNKLKL